MRRDNGFVILVIYPISIAVSGYETKMMLRHSTDNALLIQIRRTDSRVINAIVSTELFSFISTRFKESVKLCLVIVIICYQYFFHIYFFERFS